MIIAVVIGVVPLIIRTVQTSGKDVHGLLLFNRKIVA